MFSKIKSLFSKEAAPKHSQSQFKHPLVDDGDVSECPFMAKQKNSNAAPKKQKKQKNQENSDTESEEEDKPKGGCPFMVTSQGKKNPNLSIDHEGYDQPFVSKYKYYLSANKINFDQVTKGKRVRPIIRQKFNSFPIYLQHTVFFNGQDYQKVRSFQCCSRFMAYENLRERGNKYYNKGKFLKALQFYERAMSLFRWLEHKEPENLTETESLENSMSNDLTSQSQLSQEDTMSKIPINLGGQKVELNPEKDNKEFNEFRDKFKQFFVIYNDENVIQHNGQEFTEMVDIDMRKSLLIQVYLNMAATYINLDNFTVAEQVLNDAMSESGQVSQVYLRMAQAILANKTSSLSRLEEGRQLIKVAIDLQKDEKIFQNTNPNLLKMVNIHDAKEVYASVLTKIGKRIEEQTERQLKAKSEIEARLEHINKIEKQMIAEGKTPRQSKNSTLLSAGSDFRILMKVYAKYVRILEFFGEAKDRQQINLAKRQFQEILKALHEIKSIESIEIDTKDNSKFGEDPNKISNRVTYIKKQKCEEIYNTAKYNYQVLEWAIKQVVAEEQAEQERRKKEEEQETKLRQAESAQEVKQKSDLMSKLPYVLVLAPVVGIIINYLI